VDAQELPLELVGRPERLDGGSLSLGRVSAGRDSPLDRLLEMVSELGLELRADPDRQAAHDDAQVPLALRSQALH
jgi:hypothetical protein